MKDQLPSRPTPGRKRKGEGSQRRVEILDAAKQLFVEEGYAATTIRRIAAKLGISNGVKTELIEGLKEGEKVILQ